MWSPVFHLPARQAVTETPDDARLAMQVQYAKGMLEMAPQDGIGVALSYLLMASMRHPEMLRRVLNEQVIREGFGGVSMIETLNRLCR
jgi:hypothetical protein